VRLYVDLETLELIEGPGFRNPVTSLRFKRGDAAKLEVSFLANGTTASEIGDPLTLELQFGIKPRGRYDVGYLVHESAWVLPAVGAASPLYSCSPGFNTVELDSAMQVGSSTGTELSEIILMGEITWREGSGEPTSTRTFLVIVENDVNRGTEGTPLAGQTPAGWLAAQLASGDLDGAIHLGGNDLVTLAGSTITFDFGAFSYASGTAKTAHLNALGLGTSGILSCSSVSASTMSAGSMAVSGTLAVSGASTATLSSTSLVFGSTSYSGSSVSLAGGSATLSTSALTFGSTSYGSGSLTLASGFGYASMAGIYYTGQFNFPSGGVNFGGPAGLKSYTTSAANALSGKTTGMLIHVSDESGGSTLAFWNGSAWKRVQDLATISSSPPP
jgi:hypothetical protein